jgi:peptide/nickel transport system permease protein
MKQLLARLSLLLATLWLIITVAFACVQELPGDSARLILGHQASDEAVRKFRINAGLGKPLAKRYLIFLNRTLHFDLGISLAQRRPVLDLILERGVVTLRLIFAATCIVAVFSFFTPVFLRLIGGRELADALSHFWTTLAVVPPYVFGVVLLEFFGSYLGWISVIFNPFSAGAWVLPAVALAAYPTAVVLRLFNQQLARVMSSPYILRARAMGFPYYAVLLREALPNALPAALAGLANGLAFFVTGTFFVEVIFGMSGIGRLIYEAISSKDVAVLAPLCMVLAIAVSIVSAVLDLAQLLLDPRLRAGHA